MRYIILGMSDYSHIKSLETIDLKKMYLGKRQDFKYTKDFKFSQKYSHFLKRNIKAVFVDSVTLDFLWSSNYKVLMDEEMDRL